MSRTQPDGMLDDELAHGDGRGWQVAWFGSFGVDGALPIAIGALCALAVVRKGSPAWLLLLVPGLCWFVWQLARWFDARLLIRVLMVTFLALAICAYFFLFFGADMAKLHEALADENIGLVGVVGEGDSVVITVLTPYWNSKGALRAIVPAAYQHARSKKAIKVQWGDLITTTIKMKDIQEFMDGRITEEELFSRMVSSG